MIGRIDPERRRVHLRQTAARVADRLANVAAYRLTQAGVQLSPEEQALTARLLRAVMLEVTSRVLERELVGDLV